MTTELHERRLEAALAVVRESGAGSVADLGCGEGDLLLRLAAEPSIARIVGLDLSRDALERLRASLREAPAERRAKVELLQGSVTEVGPALGRIDAALLVELIEHLEPDRLGEMERAVFGRLRPALVAITTPNADFNPLLGVPGSRLRRPDHRFEWGRDRFRSWAAGVARRNGFRLDCSDLGGAHPVLGGPSQMAVFTR